MRDATGKAFYCSISMVHLRFDPEAMEEDEEEKSEASPAAATSPATHHHIEFKLPHCCSTAIAGSCYVFRAACNTSADAVVASTSDNIIKAYSVSSSQLAHVCDLRGHGGSITEVMFTDASSMLHSSSVDGTVKGWDLRSGGQAER